MPFIVFVNGIDDAAGQDKDGLEAQRKMLVEQFDDDDVLVFDIFKNQSPEIWEGYLHRMAKNLIEKIWQNTDRSDRIGGRSIVFVAHNIGAAIVKQVLLIASENHSLSWISTHTSALYLIESPTYTENQKWEDFLVRLLSSGRLPLSNLADLIQILPGELTRCEIQFSAIAQAYDIRLRNRADGHVYGCVDDPWYFRDDGKRLLEVFDSVYALKRKLNHRLSEPYIRFTNSLWKAELSTGRLTPSSADLHSISWLEDNETFKRWTEDPGSNLLAIKGEPGAGKTHVASHILYTLRMQDAQKIAEQTEQTEQTEQASANPEDEAIFLSFSFYRWDITRNTEWNLVSSLIRQLLFLRPFIFRRISAWSHALSSIKPATSSQLWLFFRYMLTIPCASKVYIIINAADECQASILETVASLVVSPEPGALPTKILLAVSSSDAIPEGPAIRHLQMDAAQRKNVIHTATVQRVNRILSKRPVWLDKKDAIVERVTHGDNYLYSMLSLDLLEHIGLPSTQAALQKLLGTPPQSLDHIFESIVIQVQQSDQACLALQWIYHAARPLTVSELAVAMALSGLMSEHRAKPAQKDAEEHKLTFNDVVANVSWDIVRDLAGKLGPAIKIVNDRVMLVHHSFRRYLESCSRPVITPGFHATIAEQCMWYISESSRDFNYKMLQVYRLGHMEIGIAAELIDYAELYWSEHLKLAGESAAYLDDKVVQFLTESTIPKYVRSEASSRSRSVSRSRIRAGSRSKSRSINRSRSPSKSRLESHHTSPSRARSGSRPGSPARPEAACEETARPDDEIKPDVEPEANAVADDLNAAENKPDVEPETNAVADDLNAAFNDPIAPYPEENERASKDGNESERGRSRSPIASPPSSRSSSLVSHSLHEDVRPPINHWINFRATMNSWPRVVTIQPLCTAIQLGIDRVVEIMMRDIDLVSQRIEERVVDILATAANVGNFKIVDEVLAAREFADDALTRALNFAAYNGHAVVVERLLRPLATTEYFREWKDGTLVGMNPLISAVSGGHYDIIELLLKEGASLLSKDHNVDTPAHCAARLGDAESLHTFKRLRQADFISSLTQGNKDNMNPLRIACEVGQVESFNVLLEDGREYAPDAVTPTDMPLPLNIAATYGHVAIWKKLVEAGADPLTGEPLEVPEEWTYEESTQLRALEGEPTQLELASRQGFYDLAVAILECLNKSVVPTEKGEKDKDGGRRRTRGREKDKTKDNDELEAKKIRRKDILISSLFEAASNGHVKLVTLFLGETDRDETVDRKYLRLAIGRGHFNVIKLLCSAGIAMKNSNGEYNSHFDLAISENSVDIVRFLISHGLRSEWDGVETSIQYASRVGRIISLRMLLAAADDALAELRQQSVDGFTAIELAADNVELGTFKELLKWEESLEGEKTRSTRLLNLAIRGTGRNRDKKLAFINFLLENEWEVNVGDGTDDIPLHAAINSNEISLAQMFLDLGANPNMVDTNGENALHRATTMQANDLVSPLLEKGVDQDVVSKSDYTPILIAAKFNMNEIFRRLLRLYPFPWLEADGEPENNDHRPAKIDAVGPEGTRVLHFASTDIDLLKSIFESQKKYKFDIDVNVADNQGRTPLMIACIDEYRTASYSMETVELLLENKADPNIKDEDGESAMFYAARRHGGIEDLVPGILRSLAKHNGDVHAVGGQQGCLLYTVICFSVHEQMRIKTLLELATTAKVEIPPFGSPLHIFWYYPATLEDDIPAFVPLLVEYGADVNALDSRGRTPLLYAVSHMRHAAYAQTFFDLHASPDLCDELGKTPLHYAVRNYQLEAWVSILLENKADVMKVDKMGHSVLYAASLVDDEDGRVAFDMVLERLPEEERAAQKAAALTAAMKCANTAIIESIMREPNMDVNVPDTNGWTPLDIAQAHGLDAIAKELISLGAIKGSDRKMPTRLNKYEARNDCTVWEDGAETGIDGISYDRFYGDALSASVRSDYCISMESGIYYFEVEVLELNDQSTVAIGFAGEGLALDDMVGWTENSWGYHSDDGSILSNNASVDHGPAFDVGDVVGAAYDVESGKIWFTKNGTVLAGVSWRPVIKKRLAEEEKAAKAAKAEMESREKEEKGTDEEESSDEEEEDDDRVRRKKSDDEDEDGDKASQKDAENDEKEAGSDNGDEYDADRDEEAAIQQRIAIEAAYAWAQLYPTVSFEHKGRDNLRARVNFGPEFGAAGRPFKYGPPETVPPDPLLSFQEIEAAAEAAAEAEAEAEARAEVEAEAERKDEEEKKDEEDEKQVGEDETNRDEKQQEDENMGEDEERDGEELQERRRRRRRERRRRPVGEALSVTFR